MNLKKYTAIKIALNDSVKKWSAWDGFTRLVVA